MVKPYFLLGDTAAMKSVLEEAHNLYLEKNDSLSAVRTYGAAYIDLFIQQERLSEARLLMEEYERLSGLFDHDGNIIPRLAIYNYTKSIYYMKRNQTDSAEALVRRLIPCQSLKADAFCS